MKGSQEGFPTASLLVPRCWEVSGLGFGDLGISAWRFEFGRFRVEGCFRIWGFWD